MGRSLSPFHSCGQWSNLEIAPIHRFGPLLFWQRVAGQASGWTRVVRFEDRPWIASVRRCRWNSNSRIGNWKASTIAGLACVEFK